MKSAKRLKHSRWPVLTVAAAVGLGACTMEDTSTPAKVDTHDHGGTASLRVMHLSPDAPAVDVFAAHDGREIAISNIGFAASSAYAEIVAGTHDLSIAPAGTSAQQSVLDIDGVSFDSGQRYTAVAFDSVGMLRAHILTDDISGLPSDYIRLRPFHAAVGVGQVDIWSIAADGSATPLYEDFDFGTERPHIDLPAAAYTLGFDVDNDASPDLTFEIPALSGGTSVNLFAATDANGAVFLMAQTQDSSTLRIDAVPPAADPSSIRVIHLSPDAPAVDVWVDGSTRAVGGLAFGAGTGYLSLPAGMHDFAIAPEGGSAMDSVLDLEGVMMEANSSYTAVAFGQLASIRGLALEDMNDNLDDGMIRVRAIHAADGVGQVDIWNIPADGMAAPLYQDVDYGAVGAYLDLPAGAYTLGFDVDNDASPDLTFHLPNLQAGTVANVFAVLASDGVKLMAQLQDGTVAAISAEMPPEPAEIRVVHLSPDAPAVDVLVNGELRAVEGLSFRQGTGFLPVEPGSYSFDIVPAGGSAADSVLNVAGVMLESGTQYTIYAFGPVASLQASALTEDSAGIAAGNIRVRAIHAAAAVGQVDIWSVPADGSAPAPLYQDVDFGVAGGYLDLPAAAYRIGFDVDNDATPDAIFNLPALSAGTRANLFAVTDASGALAIEAQLSDGAVATVTPTTARIRAIHLSPDAPEVDILVNRTLRAVESLAFTSGTGYLDLVPGTYNFDVVPVAGSADDSVLQIEALALADNGHYTAVAYDQLGSIRAMALEDDFSAVAEGMIRVRAAHTAAAVGEVDIWSVPMMGEPQPLFVDVPFGAASGYIELPATEHRLGFDLDNDAVPDVSFDIPALPAGTVANVFAVSDSEGAVFLKAQLADGSTVRINPAP